MNGLIGYKNDIMNKEISVLLQGVAVGLFASWIKSIAEPPLQTIGEEIFPPHPQQLQLRGADVSRHPEYMPPAVLAKDVYHRITKNSLTDADALKTIGWIHYALGTVLGVGYVYAFRKQKRTVPAQGVLAGAVVWSLTHGSIVPGLGLQGAVKKMPKSWWVWEFGSHLVFGIAMEESRKWLNRRFKCVK